MLQRSLLTFALAGSLSAALAQTSLVVTGVVAPGPNTLSQGRFAAAQPGQSVRLRFDVQTPGTIFGSIQQYQVETATLTLQIGALSDGSVAAQQALQFQGASGAVDLLTTTTTLLGGGALELVFLGGVTYPSMDLELCVGAYDLGALLVARLQVTDGAGALVLTPQRLEVGSSGPLGSVYCTASSPNSTGATATLRAFGAAALSANDVRLRSESLPTGSSVLFLAGRNRGLVANPGGSSGILCLASPIGRYSNLVQNAGALGVAELSLDLTSLPGPTGFIAAQAGETWNFQAWYRDANPTPTSNFTDGVSFVVQ